MSARPEILWPLFSALAALPGVGAKTALLFERLGLTRPRDLLLHLPNRVLDRRVRPGIRAIPLDETGSVIAKVVRHMPPSNQGGRHVVRMLDAQDVPFELVFFRGRGGYLERELPQDALRLISGQVEQFAQTRQIVHPHHILRPEDAAELPSFEPVYRRTEGLSGKLLQKAVAGALALAPDLPEWIDPALIEARGWPDWRSALRAAHAPERAEDLDPGAPARMRLAYDEFFAHQLMLSQVRAEEQTLPGQISAPTGTLTDALRRALPFALTGAQERAIAEISADLASSMRMNRLLQGDVGAGKTLVALFAALQAIEAGGQVALMAPTEILARQHLASITPLLAGTGLRVVLMTGRDRAAARRESRAALAEGRLDLVIGTHALFQSDVAFHNLRLAIIDEQHRFGVRERKRLGDKGAAPDILVMTATPIPRSLLLAQSGTMDVSVLDEKPPGRKPVETVVLSSERRDAVIARLRAALEAGRQAYWVCPLVNESDLVEAAAAEERVADLRAVLGAAQVGLVHGQMPGPERDAAMAAFAAGETGLLVATTVIEVGVDVPNASIMVIEGADGFGLSQLHQLRGRVGRGADASVCVLMYDPPLSETAQARLEIMRATEDGFAIAEEDLRQRGFGDLIGVAQSGLPRFRVADPESQSALWQTAQRDARHLLAQDPDLASPRGQAAALLLHLMEQERAREHARIG